jgi:hypothetical protein
VDHIEEQRAIEITVTAVRWEASDTALVFVARRLQTGVGNRRTVLHRLAAVGNARGQAIRAGLSCIYTLLNHADVLHSAAGIAFAAVRNVIMVAIRMSSSGINAGVQRARQAVIALLIGSAASWAGKVAAARVETRVVGARIAIIAISVARTATLDLLVEAVSAVSARVQGAAVVVVAVGVLLATVVNGSEHALVGEGVTVIRCATVVVFAVACAMATVLHGLRDTAMVDAVRDNTEIVGCTVVDAFAALFVKGELTAIGLCVARGNDAWVGIRAIRVAQAASGNRVVVALVELAQILATHVLIGTLGVVGITAARNLGKLALVVAVAEWHKAHVLGHARKIHITAICHGNVLARALLIAIVVGADLSIVTVFVLVAAIIAASVLAGVCVQIAVGFGARIRINTVFLCIATIAHRNRHAHVLRAQIRGTDVFIVAFRRVHTALGDVDVEALVALADGFLACIAVPTLVRSVTAVLHREALAGAVTLMEDGKSVIIVVFMREHASLYRAFVAVVAVAVALAAPRDRAVDAGVGPSTAVLCARVVVVALDVPLAAVLDGSAHALVACEIACLVCAWLKVFTVVIGSAAVGNLHIGALASVLVADVGGAHLVVIAIAVVYTALGNWSGHAAMVVHVARVHCASIVVLAHGVVVAAAGNHHRHTFVELTLVIRADVCVLAVPCAVAAAVHRSVHAEVVLARVFGTDVSIRAARAVCAAVGDLLMNARV